FINNIIIFSDTLKDYIKHLTQIFQFFIFRNITLPQTKSYFIYPNIKFLTFYIDILGLLITAEKIKKFE
ncbi:hypothetical protein B0H65DRAFT_427385, partial [Neurospora tetraspora]